MPSHRMRPIAVMAARATGSFSTCTATIRYAGYTDCVLSAGHRGDHEDEEGVRWQDDEAIY
jgi:hypothetical protein